jgi:deazaflavin-dependent oxidoreductase (nitroreductase family)
MNWNSLKDNGAKLMNLAHRLVLTASGNRLLAQPFGMPLVELHTKGRKSGLPRSCYLTTPVYDSKRVVVLIASKGGDDRNPDWYRNLQAAPRRHSGEERPTARSPRAYRQRSRKGRVVAENRCVS